MSSDVFEPLKDYKPLTPRRRKSSGIIWKFPLNNTSNIHNNVINTTKNDHSVSGLFDCI